MPPRLADSSAASSEAGVSRAAAHPAFSRSRRLRRWGARRSASAIAVGPNYTRASPRRTRCVTMGFGVYLPTFAWPDPTFDHAARVRAFARKAEELGFDALWVAEHFLEAPGLYGTVWMSPLLCLAHAANVTTRIRLATGLLIARYYHPVTLAREIQTLLYLSGGRFVLGIGPGWDQHEFETLGMELADLGHGTGAILAASRLVLTERDCR